MQEPYHDLVRAIARGDNRLAESFFRKPGGRRYLENLTLILLHVLAPHHTGKEELFAGFREVLDGVEESLRRQKEGVKILDEVFPNS